jgi:hypothetical protein
MRLLGPIAAILIGGLAGIVLPAQSQEVECEYFVCVPPGGAVECLRGDGVNEPCCSPWGSCIP